MKKVLFLLTLTLSFSIFAQEDCKCGDATYQIAGEMVSKEVQSNGWYTENYAGIIGDKVVFGSKHFILKDEAPVLNHIYVKTIPIKNIDWRFNDMFGSNSKYEEKIGQDGKKRVELTLGPAFGSANVCEWIDDQCHTSVAGMSPNMKRYEKGSAIWTLFENKEQMLKFTDSVKAKQDEMK
ncbi:MAG: hypothetical protein KDC84_10830 [Crocinitomicaceae bacterium]|nr:hypothetical protein [Crocinitomicaceae bacterium]